jgi:hypothetical protein
LLQGGNPRKENAGFVSAEAPTTPLSIADGPTHMSRKAHIQNQLATQ